MFINEGASGSYKKNLMPANKIDVRNPIKKIQNKNVEIQRSFFPELDTCFIAFSSVTGEMEIRFNNALEYGYPTILITNSHDENAQISTYLILNKPYKTFEIFSSKFIKLKSEILLITYEDFKKNLSKIYHIDFKLYLLILIPKLGEKSQFIRELIKLKINKDMN